MGGAGTSATNTGSIQAAEAELRANGGNVYALAGNTGGIIEATGVSSNDGKVLLIASDGTVTANGAIEATGEVETSGQTVNFAGLTLKAANWLIDPENRRDPRYRPRRRLGLRVRRRRRPGGLSGWRRDHRRLRHRRGLGGQLRRPPGWRRPSAM